MKRENSDFDLFHQPIKKKPDSSAPKKPASQPSKKPAEDLDEEISDLAKTEATEILKHIRIKHSELQKKAGDVYDLSGYTRDGIKRLIKSLGSDEEERISHETQELENKINQALGSDTKLQSQKFKESKDTKARLAKTVSSRKKWISMQ